MRAINEYIRIIIDSIKCYYFALRILIDSIKCYYFAQASTQNFMDKTCT